MSTKTKLKWVAILNALMAGVNIYFDNYWLGAFHILLYILMMELYNTTKEKK